MRERIQWVFALLIVFVASVMVIAGKIKNIFLRSVSKQ